MDQFELYLNKTYNLRALPTTTRTRLLENKKSFKKSFRTTKVKPVNHLFGHYIYDISYLSLINIAMAVEPPKKS